MKRFAILLLLAALAMPVTAHAMTRTYLLYGGSPDSSEQATPWIPVKGATKVVIRMWSQKAAFHASTDADSTVSDSLVGFNLLFSDSVCCMVAGTDGILHASAADSFVITASDTSFKMIRTYPSSVNKILRSPANGGGVYVTVFPVSPLSATPLAGDAISARLMRVRFTPLRRMTVTGGQSTAGKRVNGLKNFRMEADVYFLTGDR